MSNADPVIQFPGDECTMPGRRLPPLPKSWKNLVKAVVRTARRVPDKIFAYDSDGTSITFKDTVRGATALSCALQRRVGKGGNIGVLMPPCIAGALANLSTVMSGNAVVNLNLLSEQIANTVIADAKITYTITSKKVMEKLKNPKLGLPDHLPGGFARGDNGRRSHFRFHHLGCLPTQGHVRDIRRRQVLASSDSHRHVHLRFHRRAQRR